MALTLKPPNLPLLVASRSIKSTSLSLTVEVNFRARSTITLPHLGMKREKVQTKLQMTKMNRELIYFLNFQMVESHKTKHLIKWSGLVFISIGNRSNASAIKPESTLWVRFENSLKIVRAFRRVQFERIFKYHEQCKSARAFIRLLVYHMTGKITKARAFNLFYMQCKLRINNKLACFQPITTK